MIPELLPLIPPQHVQYGEVFCGGLSFLFAKPKSKHEFINDFDLRVSNFWDVCKNKNEFEELKHLVKNTLHNENDYIKSKEILSKGIENKVWYAWSLWVQTTISFSNKINGGFAFSSDGRKQSGTTRRKREEFDFWIHDRMKDVEVFNRDAIELIL